MSMKLYHAFEHTRILTLMSVDNGALRIDEYKILPSDKESVVYSIYRRMEKHSHLEFSNKDRLCLRWALPSNPYDCIDVRFHHIEVNTYQH